MVTPSETRLCPRDQTSLQNGAGGLGEDVCSTCQGRFLEQSIGHRLFVDLMGIRSDLLRALANEGPRRIQCPHCHSRMTETWARGVNVDMCSGCGGVWLDGGELKRIAGGLMDEVRVNAGPDPVGTSPSVDTSGLHLADRPRTKTQSIRFHVQCVNCDSVLDLQQTNWLINTRPWCPTCAEPYTGVMGWVSAIPFGGVLRFLWNALTTHRNTLRLVTALQGSSDSPLNQTPDVLRIAPSDAEQYFGPFFRQAG